MESQAGAGRWPGDGLEITQCLAATSWALGFSLGSRDIVLIALDLQLPPWVLGFLLAHLPHLWLGVRVGTPGWGPHPWGCHFNDSALKRGLPGWAWEDPPVDTQPSLPTLSLPPVLVGLQGLLSPFRGPCRGSSLEVSWQELVAEKVAGGP